MNIRQRESGDVVILDVGGKLMGGPDSEVFQKSIQSLIETGKNKVLVNLRDVPWVNSTGLGLLISSYTEIQKSGGQLKLVHVSERIANLLEVTKLHTVFKSFEREEEAISSFSDQETP